MRKILAAWVPVVVGLATSPGVSVAAGDNGPELIPPAVAEDLPKAIEVTPKPDNGAVLVVPGITTPRARSRFQPGSRTTVSRLPGSTTGNLRSSLLPR